MKYTLSLLLLLFVTVSVNGEPRSVGNFSANDLSGWTEKEFKGKTTYALEKDEGLIVLKAHSRNAASGMVHKVDLEPREFPLLRWSWKIGHSLKREDVRKKSGDDFAARVYVIFPGTFFWQTRAINYVWSARMPRGSAAPSPYTRNAVIIALQSGDEQAGRWVTEARNLLEDYRKQFGEDPPRIGAIAIMTDTDNTGEEAIAWYGDIILERAVR